jgi:hypothetical protein
MLNAKKLLYILPDLAYVAELLPAKKPNTFSVQTFRQINGEFIDEENFIPRNILKLFAKLDAEEYHVVLPDFIFTNTIVNVEGKSDSKIRQHLKDELLPKLELSTDAHDIETFVLTEFKGNSKVQLSALEKSVLAPLRVGAYINKVKIAGISPLSWAIKSVISLEPSISVLQIGSKLYSSLHYIGVDQANTAEVADVEAIAETIKTLKGAEPSIQTIYLLSNALVEEKLKELLSNTIPIQQLTTLKDDDSQMPSYVRQIIESSMRTLSLSDYPVPKFELGKPSEDEIESLTFADDKSEGEAMKKDPAKKEVEKKVEDIDTTLPEPIAPPAVATTTEAPTDTISEAEVDAEPPATEPADEEAASTSDDEPAAKESSDAEKLETVTPIITTPEANMAEETTTPETTTPEVSADATTTEEGSSAQTVVEPTTVEAEPAVTTTADVDLSQFSQSTTAQPLTATPTGEGNSKQVIKNSSGVGSMLKMVFITLAVFFATVAVGVGVGLGILQFSTGEPTQDVGQIVVETESETETAEPDPEPEEEEIDVSEFSVLVVNATTKAGHAGQYKRHLDESGFGTVQVGNAQGTYEPGVYVLLVEDNPALVKELETATNLSLEVIEGKATEDPRSQYDAVIVLAE